MSEQTRNPATTGGHDSIEPRLDWLGGRRFRKTALIVAGLLLFSAGARSLWLLTRRAAVQETSLYGRWDLTPGAPAAYRVLVRDGRDGDGVDGAEVDLRLVSGDGKTVWRQRTTTDEEGFAVVEASLAGDLAEGDYTLAVATASSRGESELSRQVRVERSFRVLVSTDKPLYQPGQTIHIRSLSLATADLSPVAEREAVIEIRDAAGNKVFKRRLDTSGYGLASADFQLADQVATGDYTITARLGDTASERTVRVERYRLPKFRVEVATGDSYFAPGDLVRGEVSARYTFGEPVVDGRVEITVSELVESFRAFATLEGRTDDEGRFAFDLALKDHFVGQPLAGGDTLISFEVRVTDQAAHSQSRVLERTVTTEPIRIDVVAESGTLVPGLPNRVYVVTSYPDGAPAQTVVEVEPPGIRVETDAAGLATVELVPNTGTLTVTAEDRRGLRVQVHRELDLDGGAETLLLRTDRALYRAGETAEVIVLSGRSLDRRVFLDVVKDGRTVLVKALEVESGRGELALDLPADLFGTLEIHAYRIMADGTLVRDTRLVQVLRASELAIRAELDKESYRPGELAVLDFFVTRGELAEQGVPAALSLAAVDEAVFALQEMRPGLERVYFALLEELLEPRYEIHGHLPVDPREVLSTPADSPRDDPRDEPHLDAAAVAFAAARGGEGPEAVADDAYGERVARLRGEKRAHLRDLAGAAAYLPVLFGGLLVLPILLYGVSVRGGTKDGRPPETPPSADPPPDLVREVRSLALRWSRGLTVPVLAGLAALLLGAIFDLRLPGEVLVAVFILTVLAVVVLLATSAKRIAGSPALPLLRRFTASLPFAYSLGAIGCFTLAAAASGWPRWVDEGRAVAAVIAMAILWLAASGALAVLGRGLGEDLSARLKGWIFLRRLGLDLVPLALVAVIGAASAFSSRAMVPMMAQMVEDEVVFAIPAAATVDQRAARQVRAEMELAKAQDTGAGALTAPTRVRRYFPETLLWQPELITDEGGHARLELPLADSITTWRLAMSAVSRAGELGSQSLGLRVFQDFFVDLELPVALTQNDQVSVPVAVYNYLDRPQTVRLELREAAWFSLAGSPSETLTLGPREVRSVSFRLTAREPGRHALRVDAHGSTMADAVEREVRVEPDGEAVVETLNGTLGAEVEHQVLIPDDALDGASDLLLKIYPGAFSQVLEGLDGIFRMPSGCFEQTSSTTYPNVLVLGYMREQGQIRPEVELKALEYINLGYQRLLTFEVPGGGFEWFGQSPAHTVLTAYGLLEFSDMSRVYEIDPAVIERTRDWLYSRQQSDGSWQPTAGGIAEGAINAFGGQVLRTTAYVAWAMASSGEHDSRLERALDYVAANAAGGEDPQAGEDAYTLALAANALAAGGREQARGLLERLDAMKQEAEDFTWWTSDAEGVTYSAGDTLAIETTALVAYAYQQAGYRVDTAYRALAWLIDRKSPNGTWSSTQATIHAMRALLRGTGAGGGLEDDVRVTVTVGGEPAEELTITPEDADVYRLISLRQYLRKGWNKVTIDAGDTGTGGLAYQLVATHYVPWSGDDDTAEDALSIELEYDTVDLEADDLLTCRVRVSANRGVVSMAIVDLGIPPGFELQTGAFEEMLAAEQIERYEVTPRQVILYFRRIEGGRPVAFEYRLRAEYPLEVKTPQSAVYPYYQPSLRAETEPVVLTVR